MKRSFPLLLVLCGIAAVASAEPQRPNIIIVFTDDQGYADLSCQGRLTDIYTPHLDALANGGVRCTSGYITAPQCSPSRAGLLTGRYQQRFGFDSIPDCPLPLDQVTVAERLREAGYATGMVGKWHLEPNAVARTFAEAHGIQPNARGQYPIPFDLQRPYLPAARGFSEFFKGEMRRYWANYDLQGNDLSPDGEWIDVIGDRLDIQTDAAVAFIERHPDEPFFLYLAYFAPHVPLETSQTYLDRVERRNPSPMPERRKVALAMLSAVDDGVGRIMATLRNLDLEEKTLVFFTSDNGAPLKITMEDRPLSWKGGAWDGSRNDPLRGEKGTLLEGGIRVPFLAAWKGTLPRGLVYEEPVISLDLAATALAVAGVKDGAEVDGVNLVPHFTGELKRPPHQALYWRFWNQAAIREGQWKYLHFAGADGYLFNLEQDHETKNLIDRHPDVARRLADKLAAWTGELEPQGLPRGPLNAQEKKWAAHYLGLESTP